MKKFTVFASAMLMASFGFCAMAQPVPEADIYMVGAPNGNNPDGAMEWALWDDEDGEPGVYVGTFIIPEGEFDFNFSYLGYTKLGSQEENAPLEIEFTEGAFNGDIFVGGTAGTWSYPSWKGGQITVTITLPQEDEDAVPVIEILVVNENHDNGEYAEYTVTGPENDMITIYWEEGNVNDIWYFDNVTPYIENVADGSIINLVKNIPGQAGQVTVVDTDPYGLEINLEGLDLVNGQSYKLVIPAKFVEISFNDYEDFENNPEIVYEFVYGTTGIESIVTGASSVTVYNLQGVKLLDNADVAALRNLSRGMYIINGKKYVVK